MKPAPFDYVRATHPDEVLAHLHEAGDQARILAGGQSLVPMLNMRLAKPAVLVDVMHVDALSRIEHTDDGIRVGAGVRQAKLLSWTARDPRLPLLARALPWVGHAQTRNRGTVVGSIAHADPSAEQPLCLLTLGGTLQLRHRKKARSIPASEFFVGMMATARGDTELIESVTFPVAQPGTGYAFNEVGRRHGDFAIVACAAVASAEGVRLGIGGVADIPTVRALPLPGASDFDDALNQYAWDLDARDDLHATARYRRELVRRLGRQTIEEALRCRS
ncbi:FAD binding domain-containing protein [Luteimonas abyssi]|uniref:FAD binding domain-containing protein n=1 Tax=Luteimonas abyssi TaxID=1247514 RepID=UPI000737BD67|nr:FAD binding domain-containing protein [Luteimonas abyssi]